MRWRNSISLSALSLAVILFMVACTGTEKSENKESTSKGSINIAVDESYKPVIEQELKVFDSSFPEAHITARFKSEKQCFEDLFKDSVRLILVSRDLSPEEKKTLTASGVQTRSLAIAMDAIALVVHPSAPDSLMTIGQFKAILEGKFVRPYTVVFDNAESGTVRYIRDSLIPGQELPSNVYAVKDNDAVLDYVSKNEHAIGVVGLSHVYDPEDPSGIGLFKKHIKVVSLRNDETGMFYQPYQAYIALQQYPLTRKLYFISRENWQGLGTGFANFLTSERGQLIFFKARMAPLRVPLTIRESEIK
jgi:phosphate transport system substrate-binding protein